MSEAEFKLIEYTVQGPLALITMARPEKLNAINAAMIAELNRALDRAEADDQVRAIVLNGKGRAFSAGFDLNVADPSGKDTAEFWREDFRRDFDLIMRFWDCPKPTVAAVHGYCLGSALEIATVCDITVSSQDCLFGLPEIKIGAGIIAMILPWMIGAKASNELLLVADTKISAERAESLGLVNRVVDAESVLEEAQLIATQIARNDLATVRVTKQLINSAYDRMGMRGALEEALEAAVQIELLPTEEKQEF